MTIELSFPRHDPQHGYTTVRALGVEWRKKNFHVKNTHTKTQARQNLFDSAAVASPRTLEGSPLLTPLPFHAKDYQTFHFDPSKVHFPTISDCNSVHRHGSTRKNVLHCTQTRFSLRTAKHTAIQGKYTLYCCIRHTIDPRWAFSLRLHRTLSTMQKCSSFVFSQQGNLCDHYEPTQNLVRGHIGKDVLRERSTFVSATLPPQSDVHIISGHACPKTGADIERNTTGTDRSHQFSYGIPSHRCTAVYIFPYELLSETPQLI